VIAFAFEFETYAALEASLFIPIFCGLWIVFFTLGALTLDSNVLLACRGFSKPLRAMLKGSKDSKDRPAKNVSTSGEKDEQTSGKMSHSSTIFVLNREMFPSKYEDFDVELLDQILTELKFQVAAVRRAQTPVSGAASTTVIEMSDLDERHRNSTKVDSGKRFGLAPPSRNSRGSNSSDMSPRNISVVMPDLPPQNVSVVPPEPLVQASSAESRSEMSPQNATAMPVGDDLA